MENPNIEATRGDILWADNNFNRKGISPHYMIYLRPFNDDLFIGAMLTHSAKFENIPIAADHFLQFDDDENKYALVYDDSFIVNRPLFKRLDWEPFKKVGQLSPKGLEFVEEQLSSKDSELFPWNKH